MKERCRKCGIRFEQECNDINYNTKMCYECFEAGLGEYEEKKRERIARENEY